MASSVTSNEVTEVLKDVVCSLQTLRDFGASVMALQSCRHRSWLHRCWDLCDKAE